MITAEEAFEELERDFERYVKGLQSQTLVCSDYDARGLGGPDWDSTSRRHDCGGDTGRGTSGDCLWWSEQNSRGQEELKGSKQPAAKAKRR